MKKILNKSGLCQLTDEAVAKIKNSKYYNDDLAPTSFKQRNWTAYNIASCWVGMNVCIPCLLYTSRCV